MKKSMDDSAIQGFVDAPAELAEQFRTIVRGAFDEQEIDDLALLSVSAHVMRAVTDASMQVVSWVRSPSRRGAAYVDDEGLPEIPQVVG